LPPQPLDAFGYRQPAGSFKRAEAFQQLRRHPSLMIQAKDAAP